VSRGGAVTEHYASKGVWLEARPTEGGVIHLYRVEGERKTWAGELWASVLTEAGLGNASAEMIRISVSGESVGAPNEGEKK
jgi:hypothetical protein